MSSRYDVIIVGGGLAGLTVADGLDSMKVLLIDMKKEPYKNIACAEWTPKLPEFAPFSEYSVEYMEIHYANSVRYLRSPGFVINREKYQKKLLERLKVDVHLGERALKVEGHKVITTHGTYTAEYIIGADGPLSIFRKKKENRYLVAINAKADLEREIKNTIVYFDQRFMYGYAWCFPRGDVANCGVGAQVRNIKDLLFLWMGILEKRGVVKRNKIYDIHTGIIPVTGVFIPENGGYFLVGDAGGFIDPLTGAGIAFARESAKMVKSAIQKGMNVGEFRKELRSWVVARFLDRRKKKREVLEKEWHNIKRAVEKSWLSSFRE